MSPPLLASVIAEAIPRIANAIKIMKAAKKRSFDGPRRSRLNGGQSRLRRIRDGARTILHSDST